MATTEEQPQGGIAEQMKEAAEFALLPVAEMRAIWLAKMADEATDESEDSFTMTYRDHTYRVVLRELTVRETNEVDLLPLTAERLDRYTELIERDGEPVAVDDLPYPLCAPMYQRCINFFVTLGVKLSS